MSENTQILPRWLTPDDVAKPTNEGGYGIAKQTQAIWRMEGKIPYSKLSSRFVRYDRHELDKWLESHAVVNAQMAKANISGDSNIDKEESIDRKNPKRRRVLSTDQLLKKFGDIE